MENPKRKRTTVWYDRGGQVSNFKVHPGNLLASHTAWSRHTNDFYSSYISGPEPDVVNVGVLADHPIDLGLDYVYYVKVDGSGQWISFGWSDYPRQLVKKLPDTTWTDFWFNPNANLPREVKFSDPFGVETD